MELKPSYKQTEVGVIPEDWDVKPIGEICSYQNGTALEQYFNDRDGYLVISIGNYSPSGKFVETGTYINRKYENELKKFLLRKNELAMLLNDKTSSGTIIGRVLLIDRDTTYIFNQRTMRLVSKGGVEPAYLYFQINSNITHQRIVDLAKPGTQIYVNTHDITELKIPIPPTKAEQEAIAATLIDADALIESLEQLIAKKRQIKQGAMQELFTGKKRLPGFSGEWEVKRFGDIAQLRTERIDPRRAGVQDFCVELEHIEQGTGCLAGYTAAGEGSSLKSVFQKGDVLFGKLRVYLRKYWLADRDGVCSTEIWVLVAKRSQLIPEFLFQLVKVERFIEAASTAYGTHMPRSDWNVVKNYEVHLPSVEEQTAIAAILSDMDAEITALEEKLTKARQLKQGMMQELLTGKTRLVDSGKWKMESEK